MGSNKEEWKNCRSAMEQSSSVAELQRSRVAVLQTHSSSGREEQESMEHNKQFGRVAEKARLRINK